MGAALAAVAVLAVSGCRVDCTTASDCDRNESCGREKRCEKIDGNPLASVLPGPAFDVFFVFPPDGTPAASRTAPVVALLTRPANPQTVTPQSFSVATEQGAVAGRFGFLFTPPGIVFTPNAPLASGVEHTVTLSTDLQDIQGTTLRAQTTWRFTTGEN